MGFFSFLFGRKRFATTELAGDGAFAFEVVGEASYQEELEAIAGGRGEQSAEIDCVAYLVPEPTNPYDRNAVQVVINGTTVAYLNRPNAVAFREFMRRARLAGHDLWCNALIVGGWSRRERQGHFGVKLNLQEPFAPVRAA
jgi:hypothetical protein